MRSLLTTLILLAPVLAQWLLDNFKKVVNTITKYLTKHPKVLKVIVGFELAALVFGLIYSIINANEPAWYAGSSACGICTSYLI